MKRFYIFLCIAAFFVCNYAYSASKGAPFDFLLSQVRTTAGSAAGGTVTFYEAGTSTKKTVWLDRNKATVAANPYTLDANGTAQLYGDGLYRIVIKSVTGATLYDRDNLNYIDFLTSGAYQAVNGDYSSLNHAVRRIGSTPTTLTVTTASWPAGANVNIPSTLKVKFEHPGCIDASSYTITGLEEAMPDDFCGGPGIDSGAAINKAIIAVNGNGPVKFGPGTYLTSVPIAANLPKTRLVGASPGFLYGATPSRSVIKAAFTSYSSNVVTTLTNDSDSQGQPYVTIENLTIDCDNTAHVGLEGGYVTDLYNSNFMKCDTAGVHVKSSLKFTAENCGFNGNKDGMVFDSIGTYSSKNNVYRDNTRYGLSISGVGGVATFTDSNIFESNADAGIYLNGSFENLYFGPGTYFEANDVTADSGATRYHVKATVSAYQGNGEGVVFDNNYFASTDPNYVKAAHVVSGNVKFRDCSLVGDTTDVPVTTDTIGVTFENSFLKYPKISLARIVPEPVKFDPITALAMTINGYIDISADTISFGAGDFTVNMVYAPNSSANTNRILTIGATGGFTLGILGDAGPVVAPTIIYFAKTGSAAFHTTSGVLRNEIPSHIVYTRISAVGYLYINGELIESFADTNNYTGDQALIGDSTTGPDGKFYQFSYMDAGSTATQAQDLWRNGGNAQSAGRVSDLTLNLMFDKRATGAVYESIGADTLTVNNGDWLNVATP